MLNSIINNFFKEKNVDNPNFKGVKLLKIGKNEIKYIEILHNPETGQEVQNKKIYKLNECDKFILN